MASFCLGMVFELARRMGILKINLDLLVGIWWSNYLNDLNGYTTMTQIDSGGLVEKKAETKHYACCAYFYIEWRYS